MDTIRQMNAPKRVVRDAQGRVSHVEPMPCPSRGFADTGAGRRGAPDIGGPVVPDPFAQ